MKYLSTVLSIAALVIALGAYTGNTPTLGEVSGITNYSNLTLSEDLIVGDDATVTDDLTVSGGSLNVATANTATSTITVGCIQTYATSTASPVKISATTTAAGGTVLYSVFGLCP